VFVPEHANPLIPKTAKTPRSGFNVPDFGDQPFAQSVGDVMLQLG
jgi:hypothetical protein